MWAGCSGLDIDATNYTSITNVSEKKVTITISLFVLFVFSNEVLACLFLHVICYIFSCFVLAAAVFTVRVYTEVREPELCRIRSEN